MGKPRSFFPFASGDKSQSFSLSGGKHFFLESRGGREREGGRGREREGEGGREGRKNSSLFIKGTLLPLTLAKSSPNHP